MTDIQSAVQWLGMLLVEEAKYLSRVEKNVKELQDELDWMLCFLREADAIQYDNVMARKWVAQIREFAYEAEDIIEQFLVKVDTSRRPRDLLSPVRRYVKILEKFLSLHQMGSKIDSLKQKISLLTAKLHTYGIKLKMGETASSWPSNLGEKRYSGFEEKQLIGRDEKLKELEGMLVGGTESNKAENKFKVVSICGDGGVGKTFLAKKVFEDETTRKHFDAFAWAYVSQPCQSSAVQQDLLGSLTFKSKVQIAQMSDSEMKNELCKVQQKKKCFIVLDGIWGTEVWDRLKETFSATSKSTLLITVRSAEVAKHVNEAVRICTLNALNDGDSKLLLNEKLKASLEEKRKGSPIDANQPSSSSSSMNNEESRDDLVDETKMDKLKGKLLKYCKGLPLAISVLGGVLATKKTLSEWRKVETDISLPIDDDNKEQAPRRILELSYYDLPYQLKPSFLYLGYFPTNLEIPRTKIIRLWEAEGLVSLPGDDESSEGTLEELAEKTLDELVERELVQVGSRGLTGKAKTCRIHDLMRELCISKADKVNWLNIVKFGVDEDPISGISSTSKYHKKSKPRRKFRRLAIYYSRTSGKLPYGSQARYIRSLLFFNTLATEEVLIPLTKLFLKQVFTDYKLLRVLDIENIEVHKLPSSVGSLIHLRYLSIRGSWVSKLPLTIRNLRCLQTLDLRVLAFVRVRVPDVLCKMERLIHLYLPTLLENEEGKQIQLKNLHKLETLVNFSKICKVEDLAELESLRKFSSCDFFPASDRESIHLFLGSPSSKLNHIEHLSLKLNGSLLNEVSQKLSSCKKLCVEGKVPKSFSFHINLPELVKLSFYKSEFESDPMEDFGKMTCLKKLSLEHTSFVGWSAMKCFEKGFPELEYMTREGLQNLEDWILEEAAMPKLSHLKIKNCRKLKNIPLVMSLKELELSYMPFSFFNGQCPENKEIEQWGHYKNVKHIPHRKISHVLDLLIERTVPIEVLE